MAEPIEQPNFNDNGPEPMIEHEVRNLIVIQCPVYNLLKRKKLLDRIVEKNSIIDKNYQIFTYFQHSNKCKPLICNISQI